MNRAAFLAVMLFAPFCWGDTVVFKNGQELEGKVLEQDEATILLQVEYGTLRISKDKVERVDPDTPQKLAKRELERTAAATAQAPAAAADNAQAQLKAKLAEAAKAAQAKASANAKAKAAATAQKTAQSNQPSWADEYIQFRRTMHNGDTQGKNNLTNSRERMDRQSLVGNEGNIARLGKTGGSSRQGSTGRSRLPFDPNQLPGLAKKYIGQ